MDIAGILNPCNIQTVIPSVERTRFYGDLDKYKEREVYQAQTKEIHSGEQMKFTRNQYQQNQINGQRFSVIGFTDAGQANVQTKGKTQAVNPDALLRLDYGYVDTVYSSQGKTRVALDSFNKWFLLAKSLGLVVDSIQLDGVLYVMTVQQEWIAFDAMLSD